MFLGERAGGAGRYAIELPGALLAAEPQTEVHVFLTRDAPASLRREPWAQDVRWVTLPVGISGSPVHLLAQFTALPPLALAQRLDVLHNPANTGPVIAPGMATIVSLLDLIWLHRAAEWEPSRVVHRTMRALVKHCVRHAERVFAISHVAAEDIVQTLRVPRERIDVTPLGVHEPGAAPRIAEAELRARYALGDARIILCVAQKRPYKNLHMLIRALPELDGDVVLVLPGAATAHEAELRALAAELGVASRVRYPDWLSEAELEGMYALSQVFVLPSLIEGFGLPILEAMARGVPVACSNVSALPEVAGDAALMFNPERQDEVTAVVRRLLDDTALAQRLVIRGRERVQAFTWRHTGEVSLAGYRRALGVRGRFSSAQTIS